MSSLSPRPNDGGLNALANALMGTQPPENSLVGSLSGLFSLAPPPPRQTLADKPNDGGLNALANALMGTQPPENSLVAGLSGLFRLRPPEPPPQGLPDLMANRLLAPLPPPPLNFLTGLLPRPPANALGLLAPEVPARRPLPIPQPTRRHVFFSFHYDDVIRVNNVRLSEQFKAKAQEVPQSFYDRSLWESRQLTKPQALKSMIQEGVKNSSVICVLIGTHTWSRRWVRYEIARAVVDKKGLVGVHINGLPHHKVRVPHPFGLNPFEYMGVAKMDNGSYRLVELGPSGWQLYDDYAASVPLPRHLPEPLPGHLMPLARGAICYDYTGHGGSQNIPLWLDEAANKAGR